MPSAKPTVTHDSSAPIADPVLDAVLRLIASDAVKVPPIPAVVAKLNEHLANPSCEMRDVTLLVGTDQALSAHILRCASSTLLSVRTQVASLSEAVMRVGTNGLFSLAVSFTLGREMARVSPLQSLRRDVFCRAAASAEFCRRLAPRHDADPEGAFLCGLLGTFGLTVALGAIEQVLASSTARQSRPAEAWMKMARDCEAQMGARVAAQWGMPKLVGEVVAARHGRDVDASLRPYVRLLGLAEGLTDLLYRVPSPGQAEVVQAIQCSASDAVEIAGYLPEVAASVWALGVATDEIKGATQSMPIQVVDSPTTTLRGEIVPASIPVTIERKGGDQQLVCVGLASDGFVAHGTHALPLNQVVKCRLLGGEEDFELVAFVAGVTKDGEYRFEMKPMGLSGVNARKWLTLRTDAAREHSAGQSLDGETAPMDDAAEPAAPVDPQQPLELGPMEPYATPAAGQGGSAPRQGGYVSLHAERSPLRRLGSWLRGRGD
ncbi:MAG TPA: HDOD domain-containing protein [Kofleriaceae bacterium]|nr:HDOD domain-containing protein [Kofleriaceae bacterium]